MEFVFFVMCAFLAGGAAGAFLATFLLKRWFADFARALQSDEAVFARVVRQFYQDDPVLTNGVWKKVHPGIVPPWHQKAVKED